nr:uncharacterized protein LOC117277398 isoform X2 [Nicotiana tomentosiformis]
MPQSATTTMASGSYTKKTFMSSKEKLYLLTFFPKLCVFAQQLTVVGRSGVLNHEFSYACTSSFCRKFINDKVLCIFSLFFPASNCKSSTWVDILADNG